MAAWPRADATINGELSVPSLGAGVNLVVVPFLFAVMQFDALETSSLSLHGTSSFVPPIVSFRCTATLLCRVSSRPNMALVVESG
jgi:hypothetical protein